MSLPYDDEAGPSQPRPYPSASASESLQALKSERTPLLPRYRDDQGRTTDEIDDNIDFSRSPSSSSGHGDVLVKFLTIWKSKLFIALVTVVCIFGFIYSLRIPDLGEEIQRAVEFQADNIEFQGFSSEGIVLHVQGSVSMNYSVVQGSYRSWVVESGAHLLQSITLENGTMEIYFQDYSADGAEAASSSTPVYKHAANASIPTLVVDIQHNHSTIVDFNTTVSGFDDGTVMRSLIKLLMSNDDLVFRARTIIQPSKGMISFGKYPVSFDQYIKRTPDQALPDVKINSIRFSPDKGSKGTVEGVVINVDVNTRNNFPIAANLPSLNWELCVPGCHEDVHEKPPLLKLAQGITKPLSISSFSDVNVSALSVIHQLPRELLIPCNANAKSPLDSLISSYLSGNSSSLTISGSNFQPLTVPYWLARLLPLIEIDFPFKGKSEDDQILRELTLSNLKFSLPQSNNPFQKPTDPPRVSTVVRIVVAVPESFDIDPKVLFNVSNARGTTDLISDGVLFARINIDDWIPSETTPGDPNNPDTKNTYLIEISVVSAPVNVINQAVFSKVVRELFLSGEAPVTVDALIDGKVKTPFADFVLTEIPIRGDTVLRSSQ